MLDREKSFVKYFSYHFQLIIFIDVPLHSPMYCTPNLTKSELGENKKCIILEIVNFIIMEIYTRFYIRTKLSMKVKQI